MRIRLNKFFNRLILTEDKTKMAVWRELNGCPRIVNAAYDGYTGVKLRRFPVVNNKYKCFYPDITEDFNNFKDILLRDLNNKKKKPFGRIKVLKMFLDNFATGEKWDTKFCPEFPGRDKEGRVQYGLYKGKIVAGNYLSNNIYGFLCAAAGIPERTAKFLGKIYSCGVLEPLISGKLPDKTLMKFRDPISDQKAISEGYKEFKNLKIF